MEEELIPHTRSSELPEAPVASFIAESSLPSSALLKKCAPVASVVGCAGLVAHQASDIFALWTDWESECGHVCDVPYWAVVWPGAMVLAKYIFNHPEIVKGKVVLDIGCGGAIAGIAATVAGAQSVIANDVDPVALHAAGFNAEANRVTVGLNNSNLLFDKSISQVDVIVAADMFYQRESALRMIDFLRQAHTCGTDVFVADGNRPFAPKSGVDLLIQEIVPVNRELEGVSEREVRLLKFQ